MRFAAISLVIFSLIGLVAPRIARAGAGEDELQKMKGSWKVVEENIGDNDNSKDSARPPTAKIDGDTMTFLDSKGKPEEGGDMKISDVDPSSSPAKLTLHVKRRHGGKDETGEFHGIYKLDGDTLQIAIPDEPDQPRPEKLGPGKHTVYWRCERQK